MYQIQIILIIFILSLFASAYPILALKYNSDLFEYTDKFNSECSKEKNEKEKNKYIWKISKYLYDFDAINTDSIYNAINESNPTDTKYLSLMKIYNEYHQFSSTQFAFFILFIIIYGLYVFWFKVEQSYQEWFQFSLFILMLIFIILFIIIYALILKKLTEIYRDTNTFNYMRFMKKISLLLDEADKEASDKDFKENKDFLKKLYNDASNEIGNIVFTEEILYKLEIPEITDDKLKIEKKDIDDYFYKYHQQNHKEEIQYRINVVSSYLYAYLIFILPFAILLFRSIDNYYLFPIVMGLLLIAVSAYFIYAYLH